MDFISKGTTINSDAYVDTSRKLKATLKRFRSNLEMSNFASQYDNARLRTSLKTREVITSFGWKTATHPLYSPYLASPDYHTFGPLELEERIRG